MLFNRKHNKKIAIIAVAAFCAFSIGSVAFAAWWTLYSDGYKRAYWRKWAPYADHLDFGLRDGEARSNYPNGETLLADGNWYGDPTVYPDTVSPSAPGVREHTKDLVNALKSWHKDLSSIDATLKTTEEYVKKIADRGEQRIKGLNSSLARDAESGDAFHKNKTDLSQYSTWVNPEKRKEHLKLAEPISYAERQELIEKMPILDVKEASSFSTPQEWIENDRKVAEYHRKVATESTMARLQVLDEIKDLQKQTSKLLNTDFGNTLSDKQKMAMAQALRAKMKVLSAKLKYINDTEKEINDKYERKKKLERGAYTAGNIKYPALDPFNPTEEDKKRMSTSSKNIGFLSFSNYKRTWESRGDKKEDGGDES